MKLKMVVSGLLAAIVFSNASVAMANDNDILNNSSMYLTTISQNAPGGSGWGIEDDIKFDRNMSFGFGMYSLTVREPGLAPIDAWTLPLFADIKYHDYLMQLGPVGIDYYGSIGGAFVMTGAPTTPMGLTYGAGLELSPWGIYHLVRVGYKGMPGITQAYNGIEISLNFLPLLGFAADQEQKAEDDYIKNTTPEQRAIDAQKKKEAEENSWVTCNVCHGSGRGQGHSGINSNGNGDYYYDTCSACGGSGKVKRGFF